MAVIFYGPSGILLLFNVIADFVPEYSGGPVSDFNGVPY